MGLFFLFPFLEITSLFYLGSHIGFGNTVLYLLGTFFVGINLIKSAGFNTLKVATPTVALEAPFRLMAGVLILIPGVFSDLLAVLILIPVIRKALWKYAFARLMQGRVYQNVWTYQSQNTYSRPGAADDIVDVDFTREERDVTPREIERGPQ